jgi:hypothetical protein
MLRSNIPEITRSSVLYTPLLRHYFTGNKTEEALHYEEVSERGGRCIENIAEQRAKHGKERGA